MYYKMKRVCAIFLIIALLLNSMCYAAAPVLSKEETVYVNLDYYGNVQEMNIYNKCSLNGATAIVDYTSFENVMNLTNRDEISRSGEAYISSTEGLNSFSYMGEIGESYYEKLPWTFDISYKINGVDVSKDELLGCAGVVEIIIDVKSNEEAIEYYKNNYMLEITGSYDMSKYLSIESDEAMITNTGNTQTLMMIVLPGQSTTLHIRIGTNNFEMDGVTMAMVPLSGEMLDKVSEILEDRKDIEDAIDALNLSADIILNSLGGMQTGLNGISAGITEIKNGTKTIHGLKDARDEDIANMKNILIELKSLVENVKIDLENLKETYKKFIEFLENVDINAKSLYEELQDFNKDLEEVNEIFEGLPDDVINIKSTLKTLAALCDNLNGILGDVSDLQSIDTEALADNLTQIGSETKKVATSAQIIGMSVQDEATIAEAMKIGASAKEISEKLTSIKETLEEMNEVSADVTSEASSTSKNLKKLKKELLDLSKSLNGDDAEVLVDTLGSLSKMSNELEEMLDTAIFYEEDFLTSSGDTVASIDNAQNLVEELSKSDDIAVNMITNIEAMLNALSSDIYSGADEATNSLISLNNELLRISAQSQTLIDSKNKVKDIIDNKKDEIEEKTTILNLKSDAQTVSFGSEKNENVSKVEFLIKTPDIKNIKEKTEDLEVKENQTTFWDRVLMILDKLFGWIFKIFQK